MDDHQHQSKPLVSQTTPKGLLTRAEFQTRAEVPPEVEWCANLDHRRTRRASPIDRMWSWRLLALEPPDHAH
jgi:hypothetical protein